MNIVLVRYVLFFNFNKQKLADISPYQWKIVSGFLKDILSSFKWALVIRYFKQHFYELFKICLEFSILLQSAHDRLFFRSKNKEFYDWNWFFHGWNYESGSTVLKWQIPLRYKCKCTRTTINIQVIGAIFWRFFLNKTFKSIELIFYVEKSLSYKWKCV